MTDTYLRQKWSDPRLSHEDIKTPLDLADPRLVKAIWKPEVIFIFIKITKWAQSQFCHLSFISFLLGVFSQCKGGQLPIRDGSQRSDQNPSGWGDSLHTQANKKISISLPCGLKIFFFSDFVSSSPA